MRLAAIALALALPLLPAACSVDPSATSEDDPLPAELDDGKADSLTQPTVLGELLFERTARLSITPGERNQALDFEVTGDASVELATFALDGASDVAEVVLYVYKRTGAGKWTRVLRTDAPYTEVFRAIGKGDYRVIVRGQQKDTETRVGLEAICNGEACPSRACAFGATTAGRALDHLSPAYFPRLHETAMKLVISDDDMGLAAMQLALVRHALAFITDDATVLTMTVAELSDLMRSSPVRTIFVDDADRSFLALRVQLESTGRYHTVVYDLAQVPGGFHIDGSVAQLASMPVVARYGRDHTCQVAPPVCVAEVARQRWTHAERLGSWSESKDVPDGLRAFFTRAFFAATGVPDLADAQLAVGGTIAADRFSIRVDGARRATLDATFFHSEDVDHREGAVFVEGAYAYSLLTDGQMFRCALFAPAENRDAPSQQE